MNILVKGMKMPKSCYDCVLSHSFFRDMKCNNLEGMSGFVGTLPHIDDRHPDCPLVPVPQRVLAAFEKGVFKQTK